MAPGRRDRLSRRRRRPARRDSAALFRWPARCKDQRAVRVNHCPFKIAAALLLGAACSATSGGPASRPEAPVVVPAPWQGPLADKMNQTTLGPATPALKSLVGQTPLVYVARVPARGAFDEPAFELAVFDDGTLVYEGHRCVKVGGALLTRLGRDELTRLGDALAALCAGFDAAPNDDELCADAATLHVVCSDGERMHSGSDHCRQHGDAPGQSVDALVAELAEQLDLTAWLGEPTHRQGCTPGARDLSPRELARTIRSDLIGTRR
jgi:hypothetical protein